MPVALSLSMETARSSKMTQVAICFLPVFLLCLLFDNEDGSSRFLRSFSKSLLDYTALHPRTWYTSSFEWFGYVYIPSGSI